MASRSLATAAVAVLTTAALAACSDPVDAGASSAGSPAAGAAASCPVTVADAWVKSATSGMTAAFGTLANPSAESVTVTAASSSASATVELHEVVGAEGQMEMQPKAGGFELAPGATVTLEPGGLHLMLMGVSEPIEPGDEVAFTLTCSMGAPTSFNAQAREFSGAQEEYEGDMAMSASPRDAS